MIEAIGTYLLETCGYEVLEALSYFIMSTIFVAVLYGAWMVTSRRPLEHEMFLVEMHTMTRRRIVEVLHVGSNYRSVDNYGPLLQRIRARAQGRHPHDGDWLAVSDTNIVIQSPYTVTRTNAQSNVFTQDARNLLTLWELEIPHDEQRLEPNPQRDGQIAAAAAISVLGRPMQLAVDSSLNPPMVVNFETTTTSSHASRMTVNFTVPTTANNRTNNVHLPAFSYHTAVSVTPPPDRDGTSQETSSNAPPPQPVVNTVPVVPVIAGDDDKDDTNNQVTGEAEGRPSEDTNRGVLIRLKFLDDTLVITHSHLTATVAQFRSSNFASAVAQGKVVRMIFQGRLMRDDARSLESYGLHEDCVVHCHVSNTPYAQPRQQPRVPASEERTASTGGADAQFPGANRADDWFVRFVLSYLTNQLTAFPVQLRARFIQFLHNHEERLRPSDRNTLQARTYRRFYNDYIGPWLQPEDPVAAAAAAVNARPFCIGNFLLWIFGVQCAMIWSFVYTFPQLCDRTAFGLLLLLTLYFVFVVVPMPGRRPPPQQRN